VTGSEHLIHTFATEGFTWTTCNHFCPWILAKGKTHPQKETSGGVSNISKRMKMTRLEVKEDKTLLCDLGSDKTRLNINALRGCSVCTYQLIKLPRGS